MSNIITICITHFNDANFVLNTLYCLKKLTHNPYKVIIRDNNSKIRFYQKLKKGVASYQDVYLYRAEGFQLKGSLGHGTALNEMIAKIDTPYGVILDADCTFLIKNWDEILINRLNDRIKIIGTQAPPSKPQDFPLMFAILFETATMKKLNIDFRPKDIYNAQDTGWELRPKYLAAGFGGTVITVKNTRLYKEGPFRDLTGVAEYYFKGHNHIFASHFGRGSTLGSAKYRKGAFFVYRLPYLGRFLRQRKGRKEKVEWINICRELTDKQ